MCAYVKIISINGTTTNLFWTNCLSLTEIMVMTSLIAESFTQAVDELDCVSMVMSSFFFIWFMTGQGINLPDIRPGVINSLLSSSSSFINETTTWHCKWNPYHVFHLEMHVNVKKCFIASLIYIFSYATSNCMERNIQIPWTSIYDVFWEPQCKHSIFNMKLCKF